MKKTLALKQLLEDGKTIIKNEELNGFYQDIELYEIVSNSSIEYYEFDLNNGKTLIELKMN